MASSSQMTFHPDDTPVAGSTWYAGLDNTCVATRQMDRHSNRALLLLPLPQLLPLPPLPLLPLQLLPCSCCRAAVMLPLPLVLLPLMLPPL